MRAAQAPQPSPHTPPAATPAGRDTLALSPATPSQDPRPARSPSLPRRSPRRARRTLALPLHRAPLAGYPLKWGHARLPSLTSGVPPLPHADPSQHRGYRPPKCSRDTLSGTQGAPAASSAPPADSGQPPVNGRPSGQPLRCKAAPLRRLLNAPRSPPQPQRPRRTQQIGRAHV